MKTRIVYAGTDPQTLELLCSEPDIDVVIAAEIGDFYGLTANPVDYVFLAIYWLRSHQKLRYLENMLLVVWMKLGRLSSSKIRRYRHYIETLSRRRILILDIESAAFTVECSRLKPDILLTNNWGIVPQDVVSQCRLGGFNVHPSELPKYRGALPTLWSLKNRDRLSAVTYLTLGEAIDSGKVISQYHFSLADDDTWFSVESKITAILSRTLVSDIKKYVTGIIIPLPQEHKAASKTATYESYKSIDLESESARDVFNKVNLYPYLDPGAYCYLKLKGRRIQIKRVKRGLFGSPRTEKVPGLKIKSGKLFLLLGDGVLSCRLFIDISIPDSLGLLWISKNR